MTIENDPATSDDAANEPFRLGRRAWLTGAAFVVGAAWAPTLFSGAASAVPPSPMPGATGKPPEGSNKLNCLERGNRGGMGPTAAAGNTGDRCIGETGGDG